MIPKQTPNSLEAALTEAFCNTCGVAHIDVSENRLAVTAYVVLALLFVHQIRRLR